MRKNGFEPTVAKEDRSRMNVVFLIPDPVLEKKFLDACKEQNMMGVKGHRSVGGYRVSLYNALPLESVEALSHLIQQFNLYTWQSYPLSVHSDQQKNWPRSVASLPYDVLNSAEARVLRR